MVRPLSVDGIGIILLSVEETIVCKDDSRPFLHVLLYRGFTWKEFIPQVKETMFFS